MNCRAEREKKEAKRENNLEETKRNRDKRKKVDVRSRDRR